MSNLLAIQAALDEAERDVEAGLGFDDIVRVAGLDSDGLDDVVVAFAGRLLRREEAATYATGIEFGIAIGLRAAMTGEAVVR